VCVLVSVCAIPEGEEQLLWEAQLRTILLPDLLEATNPSTALSASATAPATGDSAGLGGALTVLGESSHLLCLTLPCFATVSAALKILRLRLHDSFHR
jgi:hypothetical protein